MSTPTAFAERVARYANDFSGRILEAGDPAYDDARRVHNGLVDKHPRLIARCRGIVDVVSAVRLARELNLEIAVRGGGHNVAGRATVDDGLMIDLSAMRAVDVDPVARRARAEAGATWGDYNRETQLHGLASTGGIISTTGIAGLTLGGGLGWLSGKHGLAVDNLLSVTLVTFDGRVVVASQDENPDLFWAVRGGGGNFGVVVAFEYALHRVGPMVAGGIIAHPFDQARTVLRFFREVTASAADDLTVYGGLIHAPDGSGVKLAALPLCHCGTPHIAEMALRPIKAFGSPALDALGPISYSDVNTMLDAGYPKGALNYWKSSFLQELSDDAIDTMVACFTRCPTPMGQIVMEHVHGEATRVRVDDTAFPHRDSGYLFMVRAQWTNPADNARCIQWARETYVALAPFARMGRYVNYLGEDETEAAVAAAYGPNLPRLREMKAKYDPENVFHLNQNIRPAGAAAGPTSIQDPARALDGSPQPRVT